MNRSEDFYDDITSFKDTLRTAEKVSAAISALLTFISLCLLSTCLSKQCRAVSAAWYIYFLLVVVVFYGLILCFRLSNPVFYLRHGCAIIHSLFQLTQLLYSSTVFWINIEVFRTIISPKAPWMKTKFRRFCLAIGITCGVSLIIAILIGIIHFHNGCPMILTEAIMHLLKNWIPGLLVIIVIIINIVSYVRLRRQGLVTYNQVMGTTSVLIDPTEWFVCLMLINSAFVVFELAFLNISLSAQVSTRDTMIAMRIIERVALLCLGYPLLGLRVVRKTIVGFLRSKCNRDGIETEDKRYDLDMEAITTTSS